jgi:hydrogenase small subunit
MNVTRRDFLKASAAIAGALTLKASGLMQLQKAMAAGAEAAGVPVIWLQGQSCTGCSVSLLNTIHYMTIDDWRRQVTWQLEPLRALLPATS